MAAIELFSGSVSTKGAGSLTVTSLYKKNAAEPPMPVAAAVKDSKSGVVSLALVDIKNSSRSSRLGQWIKSRLTLPEGSFVEFQFTYTKPGGSFATVGCLILRTRETASLTRIHVDLPHDDNSTEVKEYIEGRFDILDLEAIEMLKVNINKKLYMYETDEIEDFTRVEILEREIKTLPKAKPVILTKPATSKTTDGVKSVLRIRQKRRINAE